MEEFKEIRDYPNYRVGNKGTILRKNGKPLKLVHSWNGYLRAHLSKDNKPKLFFVHRLVYEAFVEPIPTNMYINHKDENKENNSVENLELVTISDNDNYGTRNLRISNNRTYKKFIIQLSKDGEFIKEWKCSKKLLENSGFNYCNILRCCKGERKSHNGYLWKYKQ